MKTFMFLIILFSFISTLYAQNDSLDALHDSEMLFHNYSTNGQSIRVKIYPVSMVFNGDYKYDLDAFHPLHSTIEYNYINGRNTSNHEFDISPNGNFVGFNHDYGSYNSGTRGSVSFGKYKIEVRKLPYLELVDTCTIEWDAGYPGSLDADIMIGFRDDNNGIGGSGPRITFNWSPCAEQNISAVNRKIEAWNQCSGQTRNKEYGEMIYNSSNGNNRVLLPQDYRQDCGNENYPHFSGQYGIGLLTLNLTIDKDNVHTRLVSETSEWYETPTQIVISPLCTLKLNDSRTFLIRYDDYYATDNTYYNIMTVKPTAHLRLNPSSTLTVENTNWLILERNSNLYIGSNALLSCQRGSIFCNRGANIVLNGKIAIRGKACADPTPDSPVYISGNGIFEVDSTEFYIPDSTSYTFDSNAVFLCKPYSKIIFGKNSKLIFQNGSRINANNCTFISYDTTQTWDGIYLSDDAYDTLKNCVIQNAYNGINITQPTSLSFTNYTTEITNCTFKNSTGTQLQNQVSVNAASGILIKDCHTESGNTNAYASCILLQYCPSGGVVITDNMFNKCENGIIAIQSSPYIARNVIAGQTGTGTGIYLDNSNGTIEYNIISRFEESIECGYSSPYLLKNTLADASYKGIELHSSSVPVMKPVTSGSLVRWLGGNNKITGSPSSAAIFFEKESYPIMDSGYNVINISGSNYLQGDLSSDLYIPVNNWYDNPPNSSLFDASGGTVYYDPVFDGTSLPATDYYDLNNIGFGMYDSVFVKDNSDNPTAGSLFMEAYSNEMQGEYSIAITSYKGVISEYKTSTYAPVALARIFNCLEKNNSNSTIYSQIQSYYTDIRTDTNNSKESRELAEDFMIKSKVRQNNIIEAVNDYDNIYQNNQNNSKGAHALLNKLCLVQLVSGTGDSHSGNSIDNKSNILALISGKPINQNIGTVNNNQPKTFKLYQNYPNPFNPVTNIKYEIPKDANVSIKVYDLLGREVFSMNDFKLAGSYDVKFDGRDLASGMYFYSLESSGFKDTKKMVLLK